MCAHLKLGGHIGPPLPLGWVLDSRNPVGCLGVSEEILASLFSDEARVFQFKIRALNLAFIDGEFLREHRGRRERFARSHRLAAYLRFDLFADLQVDGAFGQVLEFDVHL